MSQLTLRLPSASIHFMCPLTDVRCVKIHGSTLFLPGDWEKGKRGVIIHCDFPGVAFNRPEDLERLFSGRSFEIEIDLDRISPVISIRQQVWRRAFSAMWLTRFFEGEKVGGNPIWKHRGPAWLLLCTDDLRRGRVHRAGHSEEYGIESKTINEVIMQRAAS